MKTKEMPNLRATQIAPGIATPPVRRRVPQAGGRKHDDIRDRERERERQRETRRQRERERVRWREGASE